MDKFNWMKLTSNSYVYVARCNYSSSAYIIKRVQEFIPVSLKNKPYNIWRDGRIFFIGNNDKKEVQRQLKSIRNTADKNHNKEWLVLKIDLNKYTKLRFRIDSSALGYNSYFTEEPIPDFCITPIDLDTWKEIDKKKLI